ncbi:polyamine ABC transporter substrate-binding protein [Vibrio hepatarius]|uniref:polyamine ABC transporter substrate-binding protein n=1 Tax=Vibrio hepatarius TaxID=171383 RepID=UPI001C09F8DC|nr:spermidine/putrescine ABC transporter substrate-binding protein [Vibrio hepatarius]MBU2897814.1 spermidine/putrescine ABC transporter substrate-binding protein [Vibrio hepatarius]
MRSLFFLLLAFTTQSFSAQSNTPINIYMWEDTISPYVVEDWESSTGISLEPTHFDNDDERSLLMIKSLQLPFDVMILDNVSAQIYGRLGIFEDLSGIKNRQHNGKKWLQACGDYAVPYFWGTVGVAYRKDLVPKPPATWNEFVSPPKELEGRIGMINDSIESFLPVFYSLGLTPDEDTPSIIEAAYPQMQSFNEKILTYEYILSYVRSTQSNNEKLAMALAYSGDQYSLNRYFVGDKWGFTIPDGEIFIWVDCLAISKHSTNSANAKKFLEYIMDPDVAAKNAIFIKASTPNLTALKQTPDWYKNDASLFPPQQRIDQGRVDVELSSKNISLRTKILNRILKSHETQH